MAQTRLGPDLDLEALEPDEAFAILGDATRLDLVRVLWEADAFRAFDDGPEVAGTLSYTALQERVGVDDNGRLNYHLSKLTPHFVRSTEEGYRLSDAGKRIARTVVAVSGPAARELSADLDAACPLCGGRLEATYEDQWLRVRCADCAGLFGDDAPEGALFLSHFPAAGMADRPAADALETAIYRCQLDLLYLMSGTCRECAGPVTGSVAVCADHEPGGDCPDCGRRFAVWADRRCATCGFAKRLPAAGFVLGLPPVVAFLAEQDVDAVAPTLAETFDLLYERVETAVDPEAGEVHVTVGGDEADLAVTLTDELDVRGVERTDRAS